MDGEPARARFSRRRARTPARHAHEHGPRPRFRCPLLRIVPDERIVYAYEMHMDDVKISVSLATVEFKPDGAGTRMIFTEQGVFLDSFEDGGGREQGTRVLLDQLGAALSQR